MKIAIGCDHAAFDVKEQLKMYLSDKLNHQVLDLGTDSSESVDYPNYGHKVGLSVSKNSVDLGIVICGSGIGISIAANKVKGVRAALCTSKEHAIMSRKHNDANILALGARFTPYEEIISIVKSWLDTDFEGGRHLDRVNKIENVL